jgi:hypothetical protein
VTVEEARTYLRELVARSSIRAVATDAGVDPSTLHGFVKPGSESRPKAKVLGPLLAFVGDRMRSAANGDRPVHVSDDGATVTLPLHQLTYWRGIVESEVRHLSGVGKSLEALLGMLHDATRGLSGFVDSGVLPGPDDDLTPAERARMAELRAMVDERRRQEAAANETPPGRAGGGAEGERRVSGAGG